MRVLLSILLTTIAYVSWSQEVSTTFYKHNGEKVNDIESSFYYRNTYQDTVINNRRIYRIEEYYTTTHTPKTLAYSTNNKGTFNFFGEKHEFYPNGNLRSIERFNISGHQIDTAFYCYPNNTVKMITYIDPKKASYVKDRAMTYLIYYDSLQNVTLTNGNGFIRLPLHENNVIYANLNNSGHLDRLPLNGNLLMDNPLDYEEGNMVNNVREGVWQGMLSGWKFEETYKQGVLMSGNSLSPNGNTVSYTKDTFYQAPVYSRGNKVLRRRLYNSFAYANDLSKNKTSETVSIRFMIQKDGTISNVEVMDDLSSVMKKNALEYVMSLKEWSPATVRGVPIDVSCVLSVYLKFVSR